LFITAKRMRKEVQFRKRGADSSPETSDKHERGGKGALLFENGIPHGKKNQITCLRNLDEREEGARSPPGMGHQKGRKIKSRLPIIDGRDNWEP